VLAVENLTKRFVTPEGVLTAVEGVSIEVPKGRFVSLIGPSGCGKSTLFNVIGGLLDDYEGRVLIDGQRVDGTHRDVGMVFQEESTFPWLTTIENVAFPLARARCSGSSGSTGSRTATRRSSRAACGSGLRSPARSRSSRSCC
jgi:ABC-type nitrate/sulfonate/bicarbonate transport system ATPase subunit